jgi:predicted N-acetyltransferase YhbS
MSEELTIRSISKEKFCQLAPNLTEFGSPDKEIDWYASQNGEVIGKLILDRIEKRGWATFGFVTRREHSPKVNKASMATTP